MNKRKKIAIYGLITGAVLFLVTTIAGCSSNVKEQDEKAEIKSDVALDENQKHSCCDDETGSEEFSEESLYQLESGWNDQNGESFSLKEFEGKKVVLTMFFATCTYACPILVNDMKKIETVLEQKDDISSYRFILISIDPEKDTPAKLKEVAGKNNLNLKRWKLLTGSPDDIMELAAVIGFKFKKDKNGGFSHSNLITFLNKRGEIIHQQVGLNQDFTNSLAYLNIDK
jgi:protein SCO1/2